jgi:hypothetical protein
MDGSGKAVCASDGDKEVLGLEHPSTLTSMHNLASTYRNNDDGGGKAICVSDGDREDSTRA